MKTKSIKSPNKLTAEQLKRQTMHTLNWYLDVGFQYATMTKTDALRISRVNPATFYRWLHGKAAAPAATLELLRLHAFGEPPGGRSSAWSGFRFQNDRIITEDGRALTTADLKAVFFWRQWVLNAATQSDRREIYAELRSIYQQA